MSANSQIESTHRTWSPWEGCQKAGPGCDHCYAEARNARFGGGQSVNWGPSAPRRRMSDSYWKLPVGLRDSAAEDLEAQYHEERYHESQLMSGDR